MAIEAINEQLLRAVGVGLALFDAQDLTLTFQNDVFAGWFPEAEPGMSIETVLPKVDLQAILAAVVERGRYKGELSFRRKRRALVLNQTFRRAQVGDRPILILECQNITRIRELEAMLESYSTMVERNTRELQREKEQVEKLLLNVMPRAAYEEYKSFGIVSPQRFDAVSILQLDFVGFAQAADEMPPATFVSELNEIYGAFDKIGQQSRCERIKTTGGTYMCIAGMHDPDEDHRAAVANTAVRFVRYVRRRNENAATPWRCRVGLGTGGVVGSVVGTEKYVYDVFGEAVTAADTALRRADAFEVLASQDMTEGLTGIELAQPSLDRARAEGLQALVSV